MEKIPSPIEFKKFNQQEHEQIEANDFRLIFESTPHPFLIVNLSLVIVAVNDAYLNATLKTRDFMIGKNLFEVHPDNPNDPEATGEKNLKASFAEVMRTKKSHRMQIQKYDIPRQGTTEFEVRYWSPLNSPVLDEDNELKFIIHHVEDVTPQILAKNRADIIEESESRFRQIANAMPQIVWTARADGFVDWYNDCWYEYTGMAPGSNWDDVDTPMHPDDIDETYRLWRHSLRTGEPYQMEFRFRRKSDGEFRWHLGRAVPVKDVQGIVTKWIGSNTDIHDQKMAVQKLEDERDLRERFVSALTHDLRTPLTAAKMSAQLIARMPNEVDNIIKLIPRVMDNLDRIETMIRDLLDANRLKAGEGIKLDFEECDLISVFNETLSDLRSVHGDRFMCTGERVALGWWSRSGFRRIIENLCSNAIKYGAEGEPITIDLSKESNQMILRVHNRGPSISIEDQKTLFDLYSRSSKAERGAQKGWGIGLTVVRGIVRAHGGTIRVESRDPDGTTFVIAVPMDQQTKH